MTTTTLKVTISGSYHTADKRIESFDNVSGLMPALSEEKVQQMAIRRYARIWVLQARKKSPDGKLTEEAKYGGMQRIRQVFVDSVEENSKQPNAKLSYIGKSVMDMNFEELQDFAAANDLSAVPLYRVNSLAQARRVAFSEYAVKVLGLVEYVDPTAHKKQNKYDWRVMGFNPNKFAPIIADDKIRLSGDVVAGIEEVIDREALALQGKAPTPTEATSGHMTLAQLKVVADNKGIVYHPSIGYAQLHKKIYSEHVVGVGTPRASEIVARTPE